MALHRKSGVKNPAPEKASYVRDLPPGAPHQPLSQNLRASVIDPTAVKIAAHAHLRGGDIAADALITDQLRPMSSKQECPTTFSMRNRCGER